MPIDAIRRRLTPPTSWIRRLLTPPTSWIRRRLTPPTSWIRRRLTPPTRWLRRRLTPPTSWIRRRLTLPTSWIRRAGRAAFVVALLATTSSALAELALVFEPPDRVVVGDRARLVLVVDVAQDVPVLVTPTHEGSAVEVVRGRLARADAAAPSARPLRFPIPIVARERGTGVVRATVTSFVCEGEVCDAVEEEARVTIRVEER